MKKLSSAMVAAGLVAVLVSACGAITPETPAPPLTSQAVASTSVTSPTATPSRSSTSRSTEATPAQSGTIPDPGNAASRALTPPPAEVPDDKAEGVAVPKVLRSDKALPSITAAPAEIDATVSYSDGVKLTIVDVRIGKEDEDKEGPGFFPGREYAILALEIDNGSAQTFSLDTVVVTVLDATGEAVQPLDVEGADVVDFAGELGPRSAAAARYAYAVPPGSMTDVTVVVDFDAVHSSAVFRGDLG